METIRFAHVEISYERIAPAHWVITDGSLTIKLRPADAKHLAERLNQRAATAVLAPPLMATEHCITIDGTTVALELSGEQARAICASILGKAQE